jgi:MtN3 and saliva related transmembrane protein
MDSIGYIAGILTTASLLPQVIKVIQTKDTKSLSLLTYIIFIVGITLWIIYGLYKDDYPLIFSNIVTLSFGVTILRYKLKYG